MASTQEIIPGRSHFSEHPSHESVAAQTPHDLSKKYSIDKIENGDSVNEEYWKANPANVGFTKHDQKDMYRMGKTQKLQV